MVKNKISAILNLTEDNNSVLPLTKNRPIAALPFAGRYRLIDFALSSLAYSGVRSVALFIGGSGRSIYDHVRSGDDWNLNSRISGGIFTFSQQEWKKKYHEDKYETFYYDHLLYLKRSKSDYVFVSGSDIIAKIDLQTVARHHENSRCDVTVLYSSVDVNGDKFNVKNRQLISNEGDDKGHIIDPHLVATADRVNASLNMYMMKTKDLIALIERAIEDEIYLDCDELIVHYIDQYSINTFEHTGYTARIDSIESYFYTNMDMLEYDKFTSLFESSVPILTKGKHGTPTYYCKHAIVERSIIGSDGEICGQVKNSIINRRVLVDHDAEVENSIILQGATIGEGCTIKYAIIDKNATIDPGVTLIGTPDDLVVVSKDEHIKA